MRLIDADRLLQEKRMHIYYHLPNGDIAIPLIDIKNAPSIDIVRCKECKHNNDDHYFCYKWAKSDNDFCSKGER